MIGTLAWIAAGWVFVALFVVALCKMAARGDAAGADILRPHDDDGLLDLACERRRRRGHVRNGISAAGGDRG